jgi:hypothetical protein
MTARFVLAVGLAALLTSVGPASPAAGRGTLAVAVELQASQTVAWSVDEKIGGPVACVGPERSWDFLVPVRGGGELTWTFTASADTFVRRLTAPARGSVHGTYGVFDSEGAWEDGTPPECKTDFVKEDRLEPTSGCKPFATRGWADVAVQAGKLVVEAGVLPGPATKLRCPFLVDQAGDDTEDLTPFNLVSSVPLSASELASGKVIRRSEQAVVSKTFPRQRGVYKIHQVNTWTVTLVPAGALLAVPEASRALRGGTATLDGSKSRGRITSYVWTFRADAGCGNVATKAGARKTGERVTIKVLCPVVAKLTVGDGQKTNWATVTVPVTPRTEEFTTPPVKHKELLKDDRVSDPPFVHPGSNYGITLGLNVAACDEKSTGRPYLCPPARTVGGTLTGLGGRYTFARVDDRGGPFDGFSYVATAPMTIDRIGILNYWVLPGSPAFVANQPNFWDYNSTHPVAVGGANQGVDLAGLRAAMSAHEGMGIPGQLSTGHSGRLQAWISDESSDPRRAIEGMFDPNQRTLQRRIDQKLADVSRDLFVATKDPLPVIWRGQVWFYDREDSVWRQEELVVGG